MGGWHMTPQAVGRLAREAGVQRLIIKHLVIENFSDDPAVAENMASTIREHCACEVAVGLDGMRFDF